MKSLFKYTNYRTYLLDYYEEQKTSYGLTYKSLAAKAGLKSPNYFILITNGKRNLTLPLIQSFATLLDLTEEELNFFEALVLENQAKDAREKIYYGRRLKIIGERMLPGLSIARRKPSSELDSAITAAVSLLCSSRNRTDARIMIESNLGFNSDQAEAWIKKLLELGTLHEKADGNLLRESPHALMKDPTGLSKRQKDFIQAGLKENLEVFDLRYPKGAAKFLSLLCTADTGSLTGLFSELRKSVEAVIERCEPSNSDNIGLYRIQVQAYRYRKDEN